MKKHLIAAAVAAAVAAPAMAQNVSVYGILDAGYNSAKYTGMVRDTTKPWSSGTSGERTYNYTDDAVTKVSAVNGGNQSSSRIGFRGTEDLGGGMSAFFTAEFGINPAKKNFSGSTNDVNDTTFDNRQTFVGVKGGFGQVAIGRQLTPTFNVIAGSAAGGANNVLGSTTYVGGNSTTYMLKSPFYGNNAALLRVSEAVTYESPSFNGITVSAMLGKNKIETEQDILTATQGTTTNTQLTTQAIALKYATGPLMVSAAYSTHKAKFEALNGTGGSSSWISYGLMSPIVISSYSNNYTVVADAKQTETALGGSYDFGVAKVVANYLSTKLVQNNDDQCSYCAIGTAKRTAYEFGVIAPLGASSVFASAGRGKSDAPNPINYWQSDGSKFKFSGYQAGYAYNLSKRTNLYAIYGTVKSDQYDADAVKASMYALGVRHQF